MLVFKSTKTKRTPKQQTADWRKKMEATLQIQLKNRGAQALAEKAASLAQQEYESHFTKEELINQALVPMEEYTEARSLDTLSLYLRSVPSQYHYYAYELQKSLLLEIPNCSIRQKLTVAKLVKAEVSHLATSERLHQLEETAIARSSAYIVELSRLDQQIQFLLSELKMV